LFQYDVISSLLGKSRLSAIKHHRHGQLASRLSPIPLIRNPPAVKNWSIIDSSNFLLFLSITAVAAMADSVYRTHHPDYNIRSPAHISSQCCPLRWKQQWNLRTVYRPGSSHCYNIANTKKQPPDKCHRPRNHKDSHRQHSKLWLQCQVGLLKIQANACRCSLILAIDYLAFTDLSPARESDGCTYRSQTFVYARAAIFILQ